MMSRSEVNVQGTALPAKRTSKNRFRMLAFTMDWREYQAIEQNTEKPSRWGQMTRAGHQVVQFKDKGTNRFAAVSADGKVMGGGTENTRSALSSWAATLLEFLQCRCFLEALFAIHGVEFAGEILD
jgi:hypothetical protein